MNIPLLTWLKANGRRQALPGDKWYLDFAANLWPAVRQSSLFRNCNHDVQEQAVLSLVLYFQDAIAQNGGWKHFTELYRELEALCGMAYDLMDVAFEEAPVNETPSRPWMRGTKELRILPTPPPEILPTPDMNENARRCLEHSGGHPLLYFSDYDELIRFFAKVLGWEGQNILPDLAKEKEFVLFANTKGILLAHDVAAYFRDSHNPQYDESRATTEGYRLFCCRKTGISWRAIIWASIMKETKVR